MCRQGRSSATALLQSEPALVMTPGAHQEDGSATRVFPHPIVAMIPPPESAGHHGFAGDRDAGCSANRDIIRSSGRISFRYPAMSKPLVQFEKVGFVLLRHNYRLSQNL